MVFALDAVLSLIIVAMVLVAANFFIFKGNQDVTPNLQLTRTGSDIIALLDNAKTLDSLNSNTINNATINLLPKSYGFRLNISWKNSGQEDIQSFETDSQIPNDKFVTSGKRFFLVTNAGETNVTGFGIARYWMWSK